MNLHHLRYFWAIAHDGNLSRAAQRLRVSQSALSSQLKKLELQLGHPLFDRTGKRLVLTEAGRIALDYADTMFAAGDELVNTLRDRPRTSRAIVRIGAIATLSRNFQLEFLQPLLGRRDIELVVRSGTTRELLAQLESHALDVVLTNNAPHLDAHRNIRVQLLKQQPVSLVGRKRRGGRRFRYPDDLRTIPVLLPSLESDIRIAFDHALELKGIHPVVLAEVDDMAMLRLLARESDAVTLVPPIVVRDEIEDGTLVEHCRIAELTERFYAIVQKRRFPNPLVGELMQGHRPKHSG